MATYAETKIHEALLSHLGDFVYSPALPIAWPGRNYVPTSGSAYLRPSQLPGTTTQMAVSDQGTQHHVGIAQIDVFWPENQGLVRPLEAAGALASHFAKGTRIDREGVRVAIEDPPVVAGVLQEPGWAQIPVSVSYHSFVGA